MQRQPTARRAVPRLVWAAAAVAALFVVVPAGAAFAAWTAPAAGTAVARSQAMPAGPAPTVAVAGRTVTISWTAATLPGGEAVSGYRVRRVASDGTAAAIGAACNTTQTGLSCTETAVAPGTWTYGVTPVLANWAGTEGPRTAAVVGAPSLALTSTAPVLTLPAVVTGTVSNYLGPTTLTFRLDDPANGLLLASTTLAVGSSGHASVSVTLPIGLTDATHTIYAVGSAGDVAGASLLVNSNAPHPATLVLANGGSTPGKAELGDSISIIFSEPLKASSLCSAWADDSTAKSLTTGVTVSIGNSGSPTSTDSLQVTAAGCGASGFHFGIVDLGAKGYVHGGSTATFGATGTSSTVSWSPGTATLTVVFGTGSSNTTGTVSASTAVYTPDPAVLDLGGRGPTGTATHTGQQL